MMRHHVRLLGAMVTVFALAVTQGCYGPVRNEVSRLAPEQRVYLHRTSGFTLHHYADSITKRPLECTSPRATGRVRSVTDEFIFVDSIEVTSIPRDGDCRISGTAWVVLADVPGLEVRTRGPSLGRTLAFVLIGVPLMLAGLAVLVLFGSE